MKPQECCVLIPSLSPDEKLPAYVKELLAADFGLILVVDDGSAPEYQPIFAEIAGWDRCAVTHHEVNKGKGAALRTGFAYIKEKTSLQGVIQPIVTIAEGQTLHDGLRLGNSLGIAHTIINKTYVVVVSKVSKCIHVKVASRVDSGVEHKAQVGIPVTVHVLRTGHTCTTLQQGYLVGDRVSSGREVYECHHSTLVLLEVIVVEQVKVLTERRLQTRVTTLNVQGVAVIYDIQQIAH